MPISAPFCVALPVPSMSEHGATMNKKLVLFSELALAIAGVFVFRGLWMLLDRVAFMHTTPALWLSLVFGSAVTVWALNCLLKQEAE